MKRREFIANTGAIVGSSLLDTSELRTAERIGVSANGPRTTQNPLRPNTTQKKAKPPSGPTPSLNLDQLHTLMEQVCKDAGGKRQVGAFFRIDWLVSSLRNQFHEAASAIGKLIYQTPFKNVSAGLAVDLVKTDLTIDAQGKIWLTDFSPVIVLTDPQARVYDKLAIEFNPVPLKMDFDTSDPSKLRFYLTTNDPNDPGFPTFVQNEIGANPPSITGPDNAVVIANGYTAQTFGDVINAIQGAEAPLDILDSFIASLPLVAVVEAMRQFGIEVPLRFTFDQGYVIVCGPSGAVQSDKCGPTAGTTVSTAITPAPKPPSPPTNPPQNGFGFTFNHMVSIATPSSTSVSSDPPLGYYYPINLSFESLANSVIGPGVVASDTGNALCFHWGYQLSARPKLNSIKVIVPADPSGAGFLARMEIDAPLDVGGGAAVSMKIGCVTVPLLSSTILGHVDPSKLTLTLSITNTGQGPEVIVTAQYQCAVDIGFYGPPMIDALLNVLMASFGDRLIAGALQNMVNSLTFPLVNLSRLEYLGGQNGNAWSIGQHFRPASALIALREKRE
jgi:hypothetical protein